jgi:hypothetical protein
VCVWLLDRVIVLPVDVDEMMVVAATAAADEGDETDDDEANSEEVKFNGWDDQPESGSNTTNNTQNGKTGQRVKHCRPNKQTKNVVALHCARKLE